MRFDKLTRYEPSEDGMFLNNVSGEYVEYCEVKALFESFPAPTVQAPVQTAAEVRATKWIAVGDDHPRNNQLVWVTHATAYINAPIHYSVSRSLYVNGMWCDAVSDHAINTPTHWQPIDTPAPAVPLLAGQQVAQGEKGGDDHA